MSSKRIHAKLKKNSPKSVKRARRIFSFRYPKLFLLIICIILAYSLFSNEDFTSKIPISQSRYLTTFIGGFLIAFGFTAPFGIGFLIYSSPHNLFIGALIGGVGATISDILIFRFIRTSFMDEFNRLNETKTIKEIRLIVKKNKSILIKHYLLYIFAGIMIATPLPDEIGVSMLAGLTTINQRKLALISFILHSIFIFLILYFVAGI